MDTVARSAAYPTVATTNLRLRGFTLRDIPLLVAITEARRVAGTSTDGRPHLTGQDAKQWITSHRVEWNHQRAVHWAVTLLTDDRLFGYVGLTDISNRRAQLSFWIDRCIKRDAHAAEAAQGALAFAFNDLHMSSIYVCHAAGELFPAWILATIGMLRNGLLIQDGRSEQFWEMSKSDWDEALLS